MPQSAAKERGNVQEWGAAGGVAAKRHPHCQMVVVQRHHRRLLAAKRPSQRNGSRPTRRSVQFFE